VYCTIATHTKTFKSNYVLHVFPDDDHRSKHVGAFKCFSVCFGIVQNMLVDLLVLIISES
jgi:hypothetical protein